MAVFPGPWQGLHAAKNDLTAAKLLLHRSNDGGKIDVRQIEDLIMQASAKIDELSAEDPRFDWRPTLTPDPVPEALREVYESQAALYEQRAQLLKLQSDVIARQIELTVVLAAQERQEAAVTARQPYRGLREREALALEQEANLLRRELKMLQGQRQRALAQSETLRLKVRSGL